MAAATSSSLPPASMTTQRPGSAAAMSRNAAAQGLVEGQPFRFEPVGGPRLPSLGARPVRGRLPGQVEDQRQVGPVRAHGQALERGDELARQIARPRPDRRASKSANRSETTQAPRASAGSDRLVEMVDPGGGEQQRLRPRG